ncbi:MULTISPECIES: hypothetical protein [unclassified Microcoleus]|uniref:hypothetical protein n=1 Tax=unclassified Microcoleus TaxID=2642155 RepID=UPI0025D2CA0E|nr:MULTISPECIES: hypothetical protein [unclassified Microcoleus]
MTTISIFAIEIGSFQAYALSGQCASPLPKGERKAPPFKTGDELGYDDRRKTTHSTAVFGRVRY